jgi:hypothetical protein
MAPWGDRRTGRFYRRRLVSRHQLTDAVKSQSSEGYEVVEKLDFNVDFGWSGGSPLPGRLPGKVRFSATA